MGEKEREEGERGGQQHLRKGMSQSSKFETHRRTRQRLRVTVYASDQSVISVSTTADPQQLQPPLTCSCNNMR